MLPLSLLLLFVVLVVVAVALGPLSLEILTVGALLSLQGFGMLVWSFFDFRKRGAASVISPP